jgi:hypothetical protein
MKRWTLIAAALVVAACAVCAQEDEQYLLRYKWDQGDQITWNVTSETTGTVIVRDLTKDPVKETQSPIWSRMMMPMTLTVEDVDAEGNATIVYEMGTMQMDIEAEGETMYICIDPEAGTMTVDGEAQALPPGAATGMSGPYRMVITPRGDVGEMELPEGLSAMMGGISGFDLDRWMKMSQGWAVAFPEEPVSVGHVWGAAMEPPLPLQADGDTDAAPPGDVAVLYRLLGARGLGDRQVVQIEMLGAMDFETFPMPMIGAMPGGPGMENFQVSVGPMHISISGTIDFDPEAGELVASDVTVIMDMVQHMKGTVETPEGPQEVDLETIVRDMTVDSTVEVAQ